VGGAASAAGAINGNASLSVAADILVGESRDVLWPRLSRSDDRLFQRVDHAAKLVYHPVVDAVGVHEPATF
jgi:hypothetical protein